MPTPTLIPIKDPIKDTRLSRRYLAYTKAPDAQQHDIIKDKWAKLSYILAERALDMARSSEKCHLLTQLLTGAAISYDKRFGRAPESTITLTVPASVQGSIVAALRLDGTRTGSIPVPPSTTPTHAGTILAIASPVPPSTCLVEDTPQPLVLHKEHTPTPGGGGQAWAGGEGDGAGVASSPVSPPISTPDVVQKLQKEQKDVDLRVDSDGDRGHLYPQVPICS